MADPDLRLAAATALDLTAALEGNTVIVGVGNALRGDDGFGPALIAALKGNTPVVCIDAGSAPENYLGPIVKKNPDTILFVDAVHLDRPPGTVELLNDTDLIAAGLTTHDIPASMLISFLRKQTGAGVYLLAVQPEHLVLGAPMSAPVRESVRRLALAIADATRARVPARHEYV